MMMLLSRSISRRDREEDGLYESRAATLLDRKSPRMRRSQQVSPALEPCACGDQPSKLIHREWSPRQVVHLRPGWEPRPSIQVDRLSVLLCNSLPLSLPPTRSNARMKGGRATRTARYLGTSTLCRMSVITESGVAPSSSASARRVSRWRNTGRAMSRTSSGVEKSRPRIAERAFEHNNKATAARGLAPQWTAA